MDFLLYFELSSGPTFMENQKKIMKVTWPMHEGTKFIRFQQLVQFFFSSSCVNLQRAMQPVTKICTGRLPVVYAGILNTRFKLYSLQEV